jgi:hypothetical protein
MASMIVTGQCPHGVVDAICWECTANIALKRVDRLRAHLGFIQRGSGNVLPSDVAATALGEDGRFLDCARGDHSFIDVTCSGDDKPNLLECAVCGAKPPHLV